MLTLKAGMLGVEEMSMMVMLMMMKRRTRRLRRLETVTEISTIEKIAATSRIKNGMQPPNPNEISSSCRIIIKLMTKTKVINVQDQQH